MEGKMSLVLGMKKDIYGETYLCSFLIHRCEIKRGNACCIGCPALETNTSLTVPPCSSPVLPSTTVPLFLDIISPDHKFSEIPRSLDVRLFFLFLYIFGNPGEI